MTRFALGKSEFGHGMVINKRSPFDTSVNENFSAVFTIVKEKNCPLYKVDERLHLSDKTLSCPKGKEMCLILLRDLTELFTK